MDSGLIFIRAWLPQPRIRCDYFVTYEWIRPDFCLLLLKERHVVEKIAVAAHLCDGARGSRYGQADVSRLEHEWASERSVLHSLNNTTQHKPKDIACFTPSSSQECRTGEAQRTRIGSKRGYEWVLLYHTVIGMSHYDIFDWREQRAGLVRLGAMRAQRQRQV